MNQKNLDNSNSIHSRLIIDENNSNKYQIIEQNSSKNFLFIKNFNFVLLVIKDENTQVLIDGDNEEEFTSSDISEDYEDEEEEEEQEENISNRNNFQEGNILQPLKQCNYRINLNDLLNTTQYV